MCSVVRSAHHLYTTISSTAVVFVTMVVVVVKVVMMIMVKVAAVVGQQLVQEKGVLVNLCSSFCLLFEPARELE